MLIGTDRAIATAPAVGAAAIEALIRVALSNEPESVLRVVQVWRHLKLAISVACPTGPPCTTLPETVTHA